MTLRLIVVLAVSALTTAAHATPQLQVLNAAARVVATTGPGADILSVVHPGRAGLPPLKETTRQGVVTLDGGLPASVGAACVMRRGVAYVRLPQGLVAVRDLPVVSVTLPVSADVRLSGAVYGEVGPARSLRFYNAGCGDWKVADVAEGLQVSVLGGGDLAAGAAGAAEVLTVGSGNVGLGAVRGGLTVKSAGSGDVRVSSVAGPLDLRLAGSGDVRIAGGRTPSIQVASSGSGNVAFGGEAGRVAVSLSGSGGVRVSRAAGPVARRVSGSGTLTVGP